MHALHVTLGSLAVGLSGLLGVALLAPRSSEPPSDTLVVALGSEPRSLDPHVSTASSDFRIAVNLYEGLTRFVPGTLTPGPGLAERWQVSDDGKTITFFLRQGVRFHDGTPFDAAAAKYNFDRMLDPDHPEHDTGPFPLSFFFSKIVQSRVVASHELELVLEQPYAPLLSNLAYPAGLMVSPSAVQRHRSELGRHPVGTGPYRFERWDAGRRVVALRNEDYHAARPALARVIFRPISDPMTRLAELASGGIDVAPELPADAVRAFRESDDFRVLETAGPHTWFLILNTRAPPFDDVRARRAVNHAVNKTSIARHVLQETASVPAGPIPSAFGAAAGDVRPYRYDPVLARELLEEAGVSGQHLVLLVPEGGSGMLAPVAMATAIQADLAAVGLEVEVQTREWNAYLAEVNRGLRDAHLAAMAWMTNDPDTLPYLGLRSAAHPPDGFNSGWYEDAALDELLEQGQRELRRDARDALYARVQRLAHEAAPWLFVASWTQPLAVHRRVRGLHAEPTFLLDLSGASKP